MPLPISSQTYMPNPLLVPQAKQMGLEYGQNIIEGIINSAQGTANVVSTIQDIEMKPQKLEIAQQESQNQLERTRIQQQELELQQEREQRLGEQFNVQQELRQNQFELKEKEYDLKLRKFGSKLRDSNLSASSQLSKTKEKELFDNVLSEYYDNGNTDALTGFMGDSSTPSGRRRQANFVDYLTAEKNMAVSSQVMSRMQDDLSRLNQGSQQAQVLKNTIEAVTFKSTLSKQAKLADQEGGKLMKSLGVALDRNQKVAFADIPPNQKGAGDFGAIDVLQIDRQGKKTYKGRIVKDGSPETLNGYYSARDSHNAVLDLIEERRRQTFDSIPRRSNQQPQQQEERPTKEIKRTTSSFEKSGTIPTVEQGKEAERETKVDMDKATKPSYPERLKARNRIRRLMGREEVDKTPSTPEENKKFSGLFSRRAFNPKEEVVVPDNQGLLRRPIYK